MKNLLCTANLQHRCDTHKCTISGIEYVYEEWRRTEKTKPAVCHKGNTDDFILNTARMRDVKWLRLLQIPPEPIDMENTIHEGAAHEINLRRAGQGLDSELSVAQTTISPAPPACGRGTRGRPRSRGHLNRSQQHSQVQDLLPSSATHRQRS